MLQLPQEDSWASAHQALQHDERKDDRRVSGKPRQPRGCSLPDPPSPAQDSASCAQLADLLHKGLEPAPSLYTLQAAVRHMSNIDDFNEASEAA